MDRIRALQRDLNHATMTGVEIGPWFNPIVPKRVWQTVVVDFTDAQELRRIASTHSDQNVQEAAPMIEEVDIVWKGQSLDKACLKLHPKGFDFLIASHVFEHLPDLIRTLQQIGRLLKPRGVLNLALPDMRFTFDFFRSVTTTADTLLAYREHRKRHAPETIFAVETTNCWNHGMAMWPRDHRVQLHVVSQLGPAYDIYRRELDALAGKNTPYVDAHAWVFTPASFQLLILELNALDLIPFQVSHIEDSELGEFIVQLKKAIQKPSEAELHAKRVELMVKTVREVAQRVDLLEA